MVFYLAYPDGNVDLELLCNLCHLRLAIMMKIARCEGNIDTVRSVLEQEDTCHECLVEGSRQDSVSHFFLRLLLCPFKSALNTVVQAESMLFQCRFEALNWNERRAIIERAFSESNELLKCHVSQQFRDVLTTLTRVLDAMLKNWPRIVEAKQFSVNVPFEHALSLVSARRVILQAGDAVIQEHHLSEFLAGMFQAACEQGTAHFKRSARFRTLHQDERMAELRKSLRAAFEAQRGYFMTCSPLKADEVDGQAAVYFPPCMSALYATLKRDRRLAHEHRFVFSLFLKEIGLDLKEAIEFWSRHYVEPPGKQATCSHTWQANTSRLTYSVRHMYGQEGRRVDYTAHGCAQVQDNGLCPFTTDKFQAIYGKEQVEDMEDIAQLCENKQYVAACKLHMGRIGKQLASEMVLQAEPFESRDAEYLQEPLVGIHKPSQLYFYIRKLTGLS
ncbi:uncharacterized protein LOC119180581 isoform X1 [Rhipicephalus microplus]|uniref:uncharacterized protein LOC119180581 isoform X1 n=1 Tax=Rhipicephalus microplus TaxID=6941 RepID=UPI003F6BEA2D